MSKRLDDFVKAYQGNITYDFDNNILLNWYPKRIVENHKDKCLKLLELGLGHGYSTNIFSGHFSNHTVIDGSPAVIRNFKEKYPNCRAKIVESYFEEFDSIEKYDIIVMGFILEHVDDPLQVLRHFRQFLKKGGVLYAAVPNAEVMNRRLGVYANLLDHIEELSENDHVLGHQRYYTKSSFENDVKRGGYRLEKTEGIYLKPLASSQMQALNLSDKMINALCLLALDYPELSCGLMIKASIE